MKLKTFFSITACGLSLTMPVPAEFEHAPPPPGDECLTNRFGRSWSAPIEKGWLVVRGEYIDAPYVVEQRGYKIFVNGVMTARVDPRIVLPLPDPPPVTEDPGIPKDITRDSSLGSAMCHPTVREKWRYWAHLGLQGEELIKTQLVYFASLPCVARVEDTKQLGLGDRRKILLWNHKGESEVMMIAMSPLPPPKKYTDEECYGEIMSLRGSIEQDMRDGDLKFGGYGGIVAGKGRVEANQHWMNVFKTLASDDTPSNRVARLKELGFLPHFKTVETCANIFPVTGFKATDNLWKRLSNDESWKTNGMAKLVALTNDWQTIPPAFKRPAIPVASITKTGVGKTAIGEEPASSSSASSSKNPETPIPSPGQESNSANSSRTTILIIAIAVGLAAIIGGVMVFRKQ